MGTLGNIDTRELTLALARNLIGCEWIADYFGVERDTVYKWRHRKRLPLPDAETPLGPLWFRETIIRWGDETGRRPAKEE